MGEGAIQQQNARSHIRSYSVSNHEKEEASVGANTHTDSTTAVAKAKNKVMMAEYFILFLCLLYFESLC